MTATQTQPDVAKRVTWRDFSFEEHVRAYISPPEEALVRIHEVWSKTYRVNAIMPDGRIVRSVLVKIVETPEGYVFAPFDQPEE